MPIPLLGLAALGGSVFGAISGNKKQKQADKLQQQSLDFAKQDYEGRAPFREAAALQLRKKINPDAINQIYADPGNPYATGNHYIDPYLADEPAPAPPAPVTGGSQTRALMGTVGGGRMAGRADKLLGSIAAQQDARNVAPPAPMSAPDPRARLVEMAKMLRGGGVR